MKFMMQRRNDLDKQFRLIFGYDVERKMVAYRLFLPD